MRFSNLHFDEIMNFLEAENGMEKLEKGLQI